MSTIAKQEHSQNAYPALHYDGSIIEYANDDDHLPGTVHATIPVLCYLGMMHTITLSGCTYTY